MFMSEINENSEKEIEQMKIKELNKDILNSIV